MKLVSMKIEKKERMRLRKQAVVAESTTPKYPWGLSLHLEKDALKKLGRDADDFEVDDVVFVRAKARVTSLSKSANSSGDEKNESQSVGLQITDLALGFSDREEE